MGIRDRKNIGGFVNCAIDDEVSRRWRSLEVSPLASVRSMHPWFMTNYHRLRFVMFTYDGFYTTNTPLDVKLCLMPYRVRKNCAKRVVFNFHVVDGLVVRWLWCREAVKVHFGARGREREHGQSPRRWERLL